MAICNVFKELSKRNGTFFTFSQYAEDLTINQSNNSYKVIPSRFICCDVDYSSFDNKTLPNLLQNNFENGCAFLRSSLGTIGTNWTPDTSKNLFWNEVGYNLFCDNKNNTEESDFSKGDYSDSLRPVLDFKCNLDLNSETLNLSWVNPDEDDYAINKVVNYFDDTNCLPYSSSSSSLELPTIEFEDNHTKLNVKFTKSGSGHNVGVKILFPRYYVDQLSFSIKGNVEKLRLIIEQNDYDWWYYDDDIDISNKESFNIESSKFKKLEGHNNKGGEFNGTQVTAIYLTYEDSPVEPVESEDSPVEPVEYKFVLSSLKLNATVQKDDNYAQTIICYSNDSYPIVPTIDNVLYEGTGNTYDFNVDLSENYYITAFAQGIDGNLSRPETYKIDRTYIRSNIVYCGDINIQSYSEKDNVGYNEIYCYIPNEAKQASFEITPNYSEIKSMEYDKEYICGYNESDVNFNGLLNIDSIYKVNGSNLVVGSLYKYLYPYINAFEVDLTKKVYIDSDSFKFNTVVVFYDIHEGDKVKYSNIPLGMFVTGIIDDGVMSNSITKFVSNNDIYGTGTSYGLRICNRFTVTPNGVMVKSDSNALTGEDAMYPALSQAMSAMVDSQIKMDQLVKNINEYQNGIKDHLAVFKNYRTNVPYIKSINNIPYWFINGKNTGQKIYYDINFERDNINNAIIISPEHKENSLSVKLSHNDFLGGTGANAGNPNFETTVIGAGQNAQITLPVLTINSSGHVSKVDNSKTLTINIPNIPEYNDDGLMKNDGSNYIGSLDLVEHSIKPMWTIKNKYGVELDVDRSETLSVENGAKVNFYGIWGYTDKDETTKLPTSSSGDWGDWGSNWDNNLPGANTPQELITENITSSTSYSQTISAPKSGLEVKNGKVVTASGDDTSTKTVSVIFKHLMYYGSSNKTSLSKLADLQSLGENEFIENLDKDKEIKDIVCTNNYAYIAWPKSLGKKIWSVSGLDNQPIEETVTITNKYGEDIEYIITRSENTLNATIDVILKS